MQAMLDDGYTIDGAAQALGWSAPLVGARAKICCYQTGQQLVGTARSRPARSTRCSTSGGLTAVAGAVVDAIAARNVGGGELVRDPGWALRRALAGALQDKLSKVSFEPTGLNGHPTLMSAARTLQIVSGSVATNGTVNGLGNLFIGYAENTLNRAQIGSHDLVLGTEQSFTSYGGLIGGE